MMSPISSVLTAAVPRAKSPVRTPSSNARLMAFSIAVAASPASRLYRSSRARERICAIGLAMFLPAISGAEPPAGSYSPKPSSFRLADGNIPMEPVIIAHSSDRISPNRLEQSSTSNWEGSLISCMVALSMYICDSSTSGYCFATSLTISRHKMDDCSTFALSMEVTL